MQFRFYSERQRLHTNNANDLTMHLMNVIVYVECVHYALRTTHTVNTKCFYTHQFIYFSIFRALVQFENVGFCGLHLTFSTTSKILQQIWARTVRRLTLNWILSSRLCHCEQYWQLTGTLRVLSWSADNLVENVDHTNASQMKRVLFISSNYRTRFWQNFSIEWHIDANTNAH